MNIKQNIDWCDDDTKLAIIIAEDIINNGKSIESFGLTSDEEIMVKNAVIVIRMNNDGDNMDSHIGSTRKIINSILPFLSDDESAEVEADI